MICKARASHESLWFWEQSNERQVGTDNGRQKGEAVIASSFSESCCEDENNDKNVFFSTFRCFPSAIRF